MGIRINGVSTPFGGASWEYTDEKEKQESAIEFLLILFESKRLITLPFSRNPLIPLEQDKEWCAASALEIKHYTLKVLQNYSFSPQIKIVLQEICGCCNKLLEKLSEKSTVTIILEEGNHERDVFIHAIKRFKEGIASCVEALRKMYPQLFQENRLASLFCLYNSSMEI